jgi:hypothetical protein
VGSPSACGEHPWAFSGGTIQKVVVDLTGEKYVDLEMEAMAAMKARLAPVGGRSWR